MEYTAVSHSPNGNNKFSVIGKSYNSWRKLGNTNTITNRQWRTVRFRCGTIFQLSPLQWLHKPRYPTIFDFFLLIFKNSFLPSVHIFIQYSVSFSMDSALVHYCYLPGHFAIINIKSTKRVFKCMLDVFFKLGKRNQNKAIVFWSQHFVAFIAISSGEI